ncbi:MAG: YihY/virulence factor BrkB family protein [Candidatus Solibacter sp.]
MNILAMCNSLNRGLGLPPDLTWPELGRRVWDRIQVDNVFGRAAELAYFFLFSVFPLLIVLTSLLGLVSGGAEIRGELLRYFRTALPWPAYQLVDTTLEEIASTTGGGKLSLGLAVSIASAAAGMVAVIEGLNTAYRVKEGRSWLLRRSVAILLTLALALFIIAALAIFLYGNQLGTFVATHFGFKPLFITAWRVVQWPLVFLFVLLALSLTYRFAPNVREQKLRWILPGAMAAFLLWLVASLGLRVYLKFFDTYSTVYGSLGALMILMLWFYLFGIAILVGGELNSILENAAAQAGNPDAKLTGEKAPGE